MATNTDYLDAQDKIHEKVAQLEALLALIIATENKCLIEGVKELTKENIFYLAGGLADDIAAAVTVIYQAGSPGRLSPAIIEALCFKSNHLCALFDVLNAHLPAVERMTDRIQQNLVWLASSLVDDIHRLANPASDNVLIAA